MKYSIKVNEVRAKEGSNIKGFATVVFGDSFKITNIAILENKDKGELFVSMPRYRSNERDESNGVIYKDVCNPITAEFREELYTNILDAYARIKEPEKEETQKQERTQEMPEFSVTEELLSVVHMTSLWKKKADTISFTQESQSVRKILINWY